MRKAIILFAFLFVLGIGGMVYAHTALSATQDDVSFTEVASYGDLSAADGLTVSVQARFAEHLIWDSVHTFGQASGTQTDFDFSSRRLYEEHQNTGESLSLSIVSDFSASASGGDLLGGDLKRSGLGREYDSIAQILRDVAARTQNGKRHSEHINLRDYFDHYPIFAEILPEQYYYNNHNIHNNGERYISQVADEEEVREAFSRYFKIPVPENHNSTVEIYKDSAGNVVEISTVQKSPVWLYPVSVQTESGIYFALQTEGVTDFSGISGGFGIYLLPASTILDEKGTELPTLDYHNLSTVYSLDESTSVQKLGLSEDKSCLNLMTREDGTLFLSVIEIATMTEKQKIRLFDDMSDISLQTTSYTDGLLFALLSDARFVLLERNDKNTYRIALSGVRNDGLLSEKSFARGYYRWYEPLIAWNGERLALVTATQRVLPADDNGNFVGPGYDICGFALEIFDRSGLKYKGLYESSLDVLANWEDYNGTCRLVDSGGLSVSW